MKIRSVSQSLFKQLESKLSIKISVNLMDGFDKDSFYNLFETSGGSYLTMNINPTIVFQYKTNGPYDKSQMVRITELDMVVLIKSLKEFYAKLSRPNMFTYYKSGNITCEARRDDIVTISFRSGGFIELEPGVISDSDGKPLPGVYLYINMKNHKTEISFDEFEYILYVFNKLDLRTEAQNLVIQRLLLEERLLNTKKDTPSNTGTSRQTSSYGTRSIFQKIEDYEPMPEISIDNRRISQQPRSLDDIM